MKFDFIAFINIKIVARIFICFNFMVIFSKYLSIIMMINYYYFGKCYNY